MRIAAVGDVHCKVSSKGMVRQLLEGVQDEAELLVMAGDLTNIGLVEEMEVLLNELKAFSLPMIAVMGNHDHENDQVEILSRMMTSAGICVLDNTTCEINGIGFVGTKGFCGGFGELRIRPFGERALKTFVQAGVDEALRIEKAMEGLDGSRKLAVLHYSPIKETLEGESPELFPFLGSSLLAKALDRKGVDVIVHGHAHNGSPRGRTQGGIPLYNVSRFVLSRFSDRAYCLLDL